MKEITTLKLSIFALLVSIITFITCQLDEKNMLESGRIHNIFLGEVKVFALIQGEVE